VVIGVSAYQDPLYQDRGLGRLVSAANSRDLMRGLLTDPELCGWPPGQVEMIPDPTSPGDLAVHLREIARRTTGTLLLYYVGHGELTATGELVLTVTTTRADAFKQTGLRFDLVRDAFNASPARVKIAILDCCGAGTIVPTVLGPATLAHRAAVKGTHILTAATGNSDAHRPPAHANRHAPTSFTAAFADVLRRGLPGKPDWLTLADLFPNLATELREQGLPEPGQAISDTAIEAPFTRNAATLPPTPAKRRTQRELGLRPTSPPARDTKPASRWPDQDRRTSAPNPAEVPATGTTTKQPSPSAQPVAPPPWAATPVHQPIRPHGPMGPPRVPRGVVAFYMAGVVGAAGCFIAGNFLPIGSGYWTDMSSGVQTAQVTLTFNLAHPLTRAIATGPDGAKVEVSQWIAPLLGLGTAVTLALALLFSLLLRSTDPDLKAMGKTVYKVCLTWEAVFAVILGIALIYEVPVFKIPDAPGLYSRDEAQSGAWMLFAASVMVAVTMQRTGKRLGLPWAQASKRLSQLRNRTPR
jgi:hypothetical protein